MSRKRVINLFSKKTVIKKARAFEIDPNKTYMVHIPELENDDIDRLKEWFAKRGIKDNMVFVMTENMTIAEAPKS